MKLNVDDQMDMSTSATKSRNSGERPSRPPEYPNGLSLLATLLALTLGTFLMALDTTIITVAIPKITTQFNTLDHVGWYGSAYLITLTAFQPISGSWYKCFDPKTTYLGFMVIFEVGSALCAAAPSSESFIVGRAIAGVGAAGLLQGALGIITYISPLGKRPIYMATVISVFGITCSMGPVLGGVFTDRMTWRWCFWINLPLGLLAFLLAIFAMNLGCLPANTERQLSLKTKLKRIDTLGILLLLSFVACLCIALQDGGTQMPWNSARVVGLLAGFGVLKALFWLTQWKLGERALIPVRFLHQRTVAFGSLFLLLDNMSNYVKLYFLPFFFQAALGTSAMRSGVNYMALAMPQFFALLISGGVVTKFGHYMPVILAGQILCVVGTGLLTRLDSATSTAEWASYLAITGYGLGTGINVPHIAIQAVMKTDSDVFLANGVATFFSQLGGTIAIPIANTIFLNGLATFIPQYAATVDVSLAVRAGPLAVLELISDPITLQGMRLAYSKALRHVFVHALAAVSASIPVALGMQWLNLKTVSQGLEHASQTRTSSDDQKTSEKNIT